MNLYFSACRRFNACVLCVFGISARCGVCAVSSIFHWNPPQEEREVPQRVAAHRAGVEWRCPFFEVSAKERVRNEVCFFEAVRQTRRLLTPKAEAKKDGGGAKCVLQ